VVRRGGGATRIGWRGRGDGADMRSPHVNGRRERRRVSERRNSKEKALTSECAIGAWAGWASERGHNLLGRLGRHGQSRASWAGPKERFKRKFVFQISIEFGFW
jgi:hypothetical protein